MNRREWLRSVCCGLLWLLSAACLWAGGARNVILFLGDAAGIPTLNAASIYGYQAPRKLFVQNMPYIGLMETSTASQWVSDSAAGMTAIMTGVKTHNGMISQGPDGVRGKQDGRELKTILEYAEERGLSTGVITNDVLTGATPAACYAHVNDRRKQAEIFAQLLQPRAGDGPDVLIGAGGTKLLDAIRGIVPEPEKAFRERGYVLAHRLEDVPVDAQRILVLYPDGHFDLGAAVDRAIQLLSRNRKGYFLMVESDLHTDDIVLGLERAVEFDRVIRRTAERLKGTPTLIVFTADHSYDFRIHSGRIGEPLLTEAERKQPTRNVETVRWTNIRRDDTHTAEEVLIAAQGPGADQVRGVLSNTDVFRIILNAYGWKPASSSR